MKIIYGLKSGALLQRDENDVCQCYFKAEVNGELTSSLGEIIQNEGGMYALTGIPVGGPYTVTLSDNDSKIELTDIYVGDLWLLGGQSNMEGAGKWREEQMAYDANPVQSIRAYYMNESWDAAKTQLHQLWESADEYINSYYRKSRMDEWGDEYPEVQRDGVGPGLYFAQEMQKRMNGVPQGVIPCGIGGASLGQWDSQGTDNFYTAAIRRVHACGGNVKGVFWYQGCSQCWWGGCETFVSDMQNLVNGFRRDCKKENLPFVQVQINKYRAVSKEADGPWTKIRDLQRTLEQHIPNLATVYSNDCELDDLIHLASESHVRIGKRAAEQMTRLLTGEGVPSPEVDYCEIIEDPYTPWRVNLVIHYKNIVGKLEALGVPSGYFLLEAEDGEPIREIARVWLNEKSVRLVQEIPKEKLEECYVCYGYGNTFYCNITDSEDRSLPGFGPLKIKDYLKK